MTILSTCAHSLLMIAALWMSGCASQQMPTSESQTERINTLFDPGRAPSPPSPAGKTDPGLAWSGSENIAVRILNLESQVKPVPEEAFRTLNEVVDSACVAISHLKRAKPDRWDWSYAEEALRCIDTTLIQYGFLYPRTGGVDQLTDGLTPFQMSAEQRSTFELQLHNRRRADMIAKRFPGPFYAVDCDTASFIYLAVAERLHLPIHAVMISSFNRRPGHTFVRWREGMHYLNWETMDGQSYPNEYYIQQWKIHPAEIKAKSSLADLTLEQVIGYEHYMLAIQYERRNDYEKALAELSRALELYPESLDSRREFAWVTATAPDLSVRAYSTAIAHALYALKLVDDPDTRDTLAATYACAGSFDLAVKEERAALSDSAISHGSRLAYQRRLKLYQAKRVYREPPSTPSTQSKPAP